MYCERCLCSHPAAHMHVMCFLRSSSIPTSILKFFPPHSSSEFVCWCGPRSALTWTVLSLSHCSAPSCFFLSPLRCCPSRVPSPADDADVAVVSGGCNFHRACRSGCCTSLVAHDHCGSDQGEDRSSINTDTLHHPFDSYFHINTATLVQLPQNSNGTQIYPRRAQNYRLYLQQCWIRHESIAGGRRMTEPMSASRRLCRG